MTLAYAPSPFESDILGVPVGRLSVAEGEQPQPHALAALADGWRADGVWLVACRLPEASGDAESRLAEVGFRRVETLVTFRRTVTPVAAPEDVGLAEETDIVACLEVAAAAFTFDRLHADPLVPDEAADRVRAAWVTNNLRGRAAAPLVVRADGRAVGFNLCLLTGREAAIDLIAVHPDHQGRGCGRRLIDGALAHFHGHADAIRVGTQAENGPSIALYRATGFGEISRQVTLHWINPDLAPPLGDGAGR